MILMNIFGNSKKVEDSQESKKENKKTDS